MSLAYLSLAEERDTNQVVEDGRSDGLVGMGNEYGYRQ